MKRLRPRLTYANVVSTLALFLVLGGGVAFAAKKLTTNDIKKGAIKTKLIAKKAVTNAKIANNAVKGQNISPDSIDGSKVLNASLTPADLLGGASVVATATAGSANVGSGPTPLPLSGGTWTQGATENDLFVAKLEGSVEAEPASFCQLAVNLEINGISIGGPSISSSGPGTSTTIETLITGARVAQGIATQREMKASASSFAFIGSCKSAQVSSLKVVVLGIG